ncbi:MAG: twin-arginine translocase TatA/TatE family subunit [Chlorobi bacterium]|nr:twin-arginine translocase TatA/TatE family subunit [Chlorobiota bacterium]
MFLFIGTPELIIVFVVALLIFGPEQMPQIARNLGKGIRMIRDGMNEAKREIYKEADKTGVTKELDEVTGDLKKEMKKVRKIMDVSEDIPDLGVPDLSKEIKGRVKRK